MKGILLLALALLQGACIIGTWPTPEGKKDDDGKTLDSPGGTSISVERCDGHDNDADGAVDEGCPCVRGEQRGCVGVLAGECCLGVQSCVAGTWRECDDLGPPFVAATTSSVTLESFAPAALTRGQDQTLAVVAVPQARCPGMTVSRVLVELEATAPVMRIKCFARDDGGYPDTAANDHEFAAILTNPFGGIDVTDDGVVFLEEP
jgi:hypothetical protein